jgi:crotonobetaine/carnitine-CoA ligase
MHDYPQYFPVRGDDDQLDVQGVLHAGLNATPDRVVLAFDAEAWTVARLRRHVALSQAWLAEQGLVRGDRVAVMLKNHPAHVALIYALILSGMVWVPVNTRLKSAGLQYLIDHAKPKLVVVEPEFDAQVSEAGAAHAFKLVHAAIHDTQTEAALTPAGSLPGDLLCLIYTSGTTGAPKGVRFTHRMLRIASEAALRVAGAKHGDRLFLWEPLCHIGGAQMLMAPFLEPVSLHVVPAFSLSRFWEQIATSGATHLHYLGGVLELLMRQPESIPTDHTIRVAWGAGLNKLTWKQAQDALGMELRECYGMTECSSFGTYNESGKPGSIGRVLPWMTLDLLDENGQSVGVGEHGEIVLATDVEGAFLEGYLDNPEASASALRGGRLFTGDIAWRDAEGDLFFVGRRTDSMRVRGENVSAWEIERVFSQHPEVSSVAAVGVKSEIGEQEVLLYVQCADSSAENLARLAPALSNWASGRLASFQLPRYYRLVERFDLTPSERIRKHLLSRDVDGAWDRAGRV